ncbi:hypothetical protein DERP_001780 [Dermatophagoides pteronyssinus]|uniref:Uncharacterized protein n=1 Tax=Dermatophagoides pteronyssinus TaxID=6956 RepID=A0ABQ8JBG1_DERPT|nr:hypothetical protein DERP_001780 [Dermatophagoides pteronyssinus]
MANNKALFLSNTLQKPNTFKDVKFDQFDLRIIRSDRLFFLILIIYDLYDDDQNKKNFSDE